MMQITRESYLKAIFIAISKKSRRQAPIDFFFFISIHFVRHWHTIQIGDRDFSGFDFLGKSQGACARPR
jgi:hypothetical protein